MEQSATYIYCVMKAARRPSLSRVPKGLPGATAPEGIEASPGLWLIVADVPLDTYGPEALKSALGNLAWVSQVALAHDRVVERCSKASNATTVPMKMLTMFSSRARAVADVRTRRRAIETVVKRIEGCDEWGVRITRSAATTRAPEAARGTPGSGTAFLAAKKRARDEAVEALRKAAAAADETYDALVTLARASTRRDDAPQGAVPPLLDAAFLVAQPRRAEFKRAVRRAAARCRAAGAMVTLTGPWPAYNFANLSGRAR